MDNHEEDFKENLEKAEEFLQSAENILNHNDVNTPLENIPLKKYEKISFPTGYIRKTSYFEQKYHLYDLFEDRNKVKNIAYALQTTDLFNYFLNRFNIKFSVGKIFYKYAIINAFSTIEGILYSAITPLHDFCFDDNDNCCKNNINCDYYIKNYKKYTFRELIEMYDKKSLLDFKDKTKKLILEIKGLRDHIHIYDVQENEFIDSTYNNYNYNKIMKLTYNIKENLYNNILSFEFKRAKNCIKNN